MSTLTDSAVILDGIRDCTPAERADAYAYLARRDALDVAPALGLTTT